MRVSIWQEWNRVEKGSEKHQSTPKYKLDKQVKKNIEQIQSNTFILELVQLISTLMSEVYRNISSNDVIWKH